MFKLVYEVWFDNREDALQSRAVINQSILPGRLAHESRIEPVDE
ncbi:hypothetical protein FHT44_005033 [Mycolicibacterium sp. BK634]|nr:hypothetical protein [Mycolicibacterium sp. BK634]MBB3752521.1 hypothetical protein [Mycolicibacterium sp. BK634]